MSIYDRDFHCREIISRAVCGTGKKFTQVVHTVHTPHHPTSILGAWVINHQYAAIKFTDVVEIEGSYDINIWYSFDGNTKTEVAKEAVSYIEQVPLTDLDEHHLAKTAAVHAEALQHPNCIEAAVDHQQQAVKVTIEREFLAELVAETKLCVVVCPGGCGDEEKSFDFDDEGDDDFTDIDENIFLDEDEQS